MVYTAMRRLTYAMSVSLDGYIAAPGGDMSMLRKKLFIWMWRTAVSAMEIFRLPTNRVVELGTQVKL